jgi:hypothetical protein
MSKDIRSKIEKNRAVAVAAHKQLADEVRLAFKSVGDTPSGKVVFKYLYALCGGDASDTVVNPTGEINIKSCLYRTARRDVYLGIRKLLPGGVVMEIENLVKE